MASAKLSISGLSKSWENLPVVQDINLSVNASEFITLIGPSGCGKSTIFNILAGLDFADRGEILFEGQPFDGKPGKVAYMPQRDGLMPWRTALDNATLGLELSGTKKPLARQKALQLFEQFGLKGFEKSYPWQLSGGMRQRLALLRTVLYERDIMLLDEPFGALDALTRASLQQWLLQLQERLHRTILFVTHDVEEALLLSDRVYVLTHRPASIKAVIEVSLPYPRLPTSPALVELKQRLLDLLQPEVGYEAEF